MTVMRMGLFFAKAQPFSSSSQVPAIAYGGPDVPPDQPSPDSTKIAESLVLLEFFADLYPNSTLLPKDPIARAQIRFFIDAVSTKLQPSWYGFIAKGESPEALYRAYDDIQSLIRGNFAVGNQFTIADAAILPFLARIEISLENDIGAYPEGDGLKALKELKSPKYSKIQAYYEGLKSRNSFQKTFNAVGVDLGFMYDHR